MHHVLIFIQDDVMQVADTGIQPFRAKNVVKCLVGSQLVGYARNLLSKKITSAYFESDYNDN
ncbi:Hypothetical protein WP0687 [Wolbachia endosymbiont of Culex quinquefasciatus Pel]|nr:Hypothetical protein WP0687 [Wolbachia endosymbiont of Culex quinquefasciatus Pel]